MASLICGALTRVALPSLRMYVRLGLYPHTLVARMISSRFCARVGTAG